MQRPEVDLATLAAYKKDILLAEIAAWLHDIGKCADAFLQSGGMGFNIEKCKGNPRINPHKAVFSPQQLQQLPYWQNLSEDRGQCARLEEANHSTALWRTLQKLEVSLPQNIVDLHCNYSDQSSFSSIPELILWGRPLVAHRYKNFKNILHQPRAYLSAILGGSHRAAHMEKEDKTEEGQSSNIDSPFGYWRAQIRNLDCKLKCVLDTITAPGFSRKAKLQILRGNFVLAPGDTRCPINEVTLWDWSSIVAALYKAEIARCVLTGEQREPQDVQWRLLSICTDGLSYLLSANSIPDLLARKELLKDAFDRVQMLLEEVYPLGLEVYRDEDGAVFVVPDLSDLLDYKGETKEVVDYIHKPCVIRNVSQPLPLRELIKTCFKSGTVKDDPDLSIDFELSLDIELSEEWDGQNELPPIGKMLSDPPQIAPDENDLKKISEIWKDKHREELCSVCGLRPQDPSQKAKDRKVCDVCEQRRAFRAKEWAKNLRTTIWMDEVADKNGRIALIVGRFDLSLWLDGTLVRSLAVRTPDSQNNHTADEVAKNPSFARLRRIWETTKNFWEEIAKNAGKETEAGKRLYLEVEDRNGSLDSYRAYELDIKGVKVPVLWEGNSRERLWIIENPEYLASRWGININVKDKGFDEIFEEVKKKFEALKGKILEVREPGEYGRQARTISTIEVQNVGEDLSSYSRVISIFAEPQVFMVLVPADEAMGIVKEIKTKYEREMGKVRNRLPLHLGVVFAPRMMPLRAVLDAGKKMLARKSEMLQWEVVCVARKEVDLDKDILPERFDQDKDGQFKVWYEVTLKNEKQITWYVPARMGDGQTEDHWYPYVLLASPDEPERRCRCYTIPWNSDHRWIVHVGDLKVGNVVYFTPATFDFIFLESSVQRHDVAYDGNGRRFMDSRKPYLLDEIEELLEAWDILSHNLTSAQIYQLIELIETTREHWFDYSGEDLWESSKDDPAFKEFCWSVIANAEWKSKLRTDRMEKLVGWAASGLLTDAFTLYHRIMKEEGKNAQNYQGAA